MSPSPSETEAADHFVRLGLPRRFSLERDAIEDAYLERARVVHPDRFTNAPVGEQRKAMERSSALNEGYRILRDPVRRAEYLVKLAGVDVDSSDPKAGAPHMDQAFLIAMIERREEVEQARAQGASALEGLRGRVEDQLEEIFDRAIEQLDAGDIQQAALALVERRYLQRLVDEIDSSS
ncbi:MAG: Fe-S protein assembly co-chaperone HscB [Deltaproteobacteria bacterium]|nr:Fe-S protein assembly co-chaperone HscB [Deltaproteobacteria bacterium]